MLVILLLTLPAGLAAFELTYRGPLITTLSPILYLPLGPGVGGVGCPPSINF
jgi:hypothetical protein